MFYKDVFAVVLDGFYIGIVEEEDYAWDMAQDCTNGTPYPLTDDNFCDRVWTEKINVNRFYTDRQTLCDKLSDTSILCANKMIAKESAEQLNKEAIKMERLEAKLRAMAL